MKKTMLFIYGILLIPICANSQATYSANTILQIENEEIPTSDFLYLYNKNYEQDEGSYSIESLEEYYELFVNFKLKVFEAKQQGLHKKDAFKKEFSTYRDQLAAPYLTDNKVTEALLEEAYDRLKYEVKASHLLIRIPAAGTAEDTLAAYNKIIELRDKILGGEDFNTVAQQFSEDPSAKQNKGDLGYFTALQMVYPFENAAFKTSVGNVSTPVRTRFGYHLLKVHDKRPASGEVTAAHILVRGTNPQDSAAYQKIIEIHKKLLQGEDWDKLCKQFSEDPGSKDKNGLLRSFTSGAMIAPFAEAAFALENPGDYSAPVKTPYGWHIIKLIKKKLPGTFNEMRPEIERKIKKDARNNMPQKAFIEKLKKEGNFKLNEAIKAEAFSLVDNNLLAAKFEVPKQNDVLEKILFSLEDTFKVNAKSLYKYLKANQRLQKNVSLQQYFEQLFNFFINEQILAYEDAHLTEKYPEFKYIQQEYYEGLLLFEIMENEVWNKAVEDTIGLKKYFEQYRANYKWGNRADVVILDAVDAKTLKKASKVYESGSFPASKAPITLPMQFNSLQWGDSILNQIDEVLQTLIKDSTLLVNIECGYVKNENEELAKLRAQKLTAYIYAKKLDSAKVLAVSTSKQKVADANLMGGQMKFTFTSTDPKKITLQFNNENALALQVVQKEFEQQTDTLPKGIVWEKGIYDYKVDNRFYRMYINKVIPGDNKRLDETRGQVISDYQNYLEEQWIDKLKSKYNVIIHPSLIKTIFEDRKK